MASNIIYNAKLRNTAICGATETILIHEKIVKKFCNPILKKLEDENCKIYGDNILKNITKVKFIQLKKRLVYRIFNSLYLLKLLKILKKQ